MIKILVENLESHPVEVCHEMNGEIGGAVIVEPQTIKAIYAFTGSVIKINELKSA